MTLSRRDFIKGMLATSLAGVAARTPVAIAEEKAKLYKGSADSVILLWMAGGMPHTETFDPKKKTEYSAGLDSRKLLSTFDAIDTNVDDIKLSSGLERIAEVMDKGAVVRSCVGPDLDALIHTRHQYHWHTGYIPPITVAAPHLGSVISKTLPSMQDDLPAFVDTGQPLDSDGADEIKSFMTAGFLGSAAAPLSVPYPEMAAERFRKPASMTEWRFKRRESYLKKLAQKNSLWNISDTSQQDALMEAIDNAHRIMNSEARLAFDISREPQAVYDVYNTSKFGQGCLLARRLVEEGVRFVEVSSEYVAFGNWDAHNTGHEKFAKLKQEIDAPIAQLIRDLDERGLLERTLVVIASEFSRCAGRNPGSEGRETDIRITKPRHYGMHRHFAKASSVVFFGGGIKGGTVYGKTADEFPCHTVENACSVSDIHATIYHALGIPADFHYTVEERPFYVTENGEGKVLHSLFV